METAKTDFKTLWENAGEKNNFSSVKLQSVIMENSDVQREYENTIGEIADKNTTGIKNLKFGEFEVTAQQKEEAVRIYNLFLQLFVIQSTLSFPQKQIHISEFSLLGFPLQSMFLHTVFLQSALGQRREYQREIVLFVD